MTEQEIKNYLESIEKNVAAIQKKTGGRWASLIDGVLKGFGSLVGAALAILVTGWILNAIGVIPAFRQQVDDLKALIGQAQQPRPVPQKNNH